MYSSDHVRCFIAYYSKLGLCCCFFHTLFIIFNVIYVVSTNCDINDTLTKKYDRLYLKKYRLVHGFPKLGSRLKMGNIHFCIGSPNGKEKMHINSMICEIIFQIKIKDERSFCYTSQHRCYVRGGLPLPLSSHDPGPQFTRSLAESGLR